MGWTFGRQSKKELVAELRSRASVLHSRLVGNHLWTVEKPCGAEAPFIGLYLLASERGEAGYKDICESMHPYYYSCPLALLEMAPEACPEWREKVRHYHAEKKAGKARAASVKVGTVVELPEGYNPRRLTVTAVEGRKVYGEAENGRRYRLAPRHLAAGTLS